MSDIFEIEKAVQQLPEEELAKFREWFAAFDADRSAGRTACNFGRARDASLG